MKVVIAAVGAAVLLAAAGCGSAQGEQQAKPSAAPKPSVGGTAKGVVNVKFTKPGPMVSGHIGPSAEYDYTLSPSQAVVGSTITLRYEEHIINVPGNYRWWIGDDVPSVSLYPSPPARPKTMPTGHGINMKGPCKLVKKYDKVDIGQFRTAVGQVRKCTFTVPSTVKPGEYLPTPLIPPRITKVKAGGKKISPAKVGAATSGSLPVLTVQAK